MYCILIFKNWIYRSVRIKISFKCHPRWARLKKWWRGKSSQFPGKINNIDANCRPPIDIHFIGNLLILFHVAIFFFNRNTFYRKTLRSILPYSGRYLVSIWNEQKRSINRYLGYCHGRVISGGEDRRVSIRRFVNWRFDDDRAAASTTLLMTERSYWSLLRGTATRSMGDQLVTTR